MTEQNTNKNRLNEQIQEEVNNHGKALEEMINKELRGNDKDVSYISKNDVEVMLNKHFRMVEQLIKKNIEQPVKRNVASR
ncbi:hypothetical protein [Peribacillus frigoritolerans]|uniref:hypothetical protein n=1 Tax=Peribacillus frigoritolerans TaxID=450367 RepID=UPI00207A3CE7|nr:hypothetical protein [Peribacillus frigoritolerans]USK77784.1 hypothetical protein LIT31_26010 [Peribacillus frigoritolerans]